MADQAEVSDLRTPLKGEWKSDEGERGAAGGRQAAASSRTESVVESIEKVDSVGEQLATGGEGMEPYVKQESIDGEPWDPSEKTSIDGEP
jgi:hypothetical protein